MAKRTVVKGNRRQPGKASKSISKRAGSDPNVGRGSGSSNRDLSGTVGGSGNAMKSGTP